MSPGAPAAAAAGVLAALALAACSGGDPDRSATVTAPATTSAAATAPPADVPPDADASSQADAPPETDSAPDANAPPQADAPPAADRPTLRRAECPPDAAPGCRSASGRILYVERVDPDGDGDAHFVLASDDSITAPGISVIDVRKDLRPDPLPGPGDRISAAGPVYRGSFGQRQVEAVVLRVLR